MAASNIGKNALHILHILSASQQYLMKTVIGSPRQFIAVLKD